MKNDQKQVFPSRTRGMNFYMVDKNLERFLMRAAPSTLLRQKQTFESLGEFAGGRLDEQAELSDQSFPPSIRDEVDNPVAPKQRVNTIRLNPEYESCQQELYRRGLVSKCFDSNNPESHILPFVAQYLISQSDISTGCPFAMTHPVAYILDKIAPKNIKDAFLPEVLRTDGKTAVCGTWATERHSGSDVGGSITKAANECNKSAGSPLRNLGDAALTLEGHNWFTSAFGFKKFIAVKTARPDGAAGGVKGLGLYLVPSHIDKDWQEPNNYKITHLKRKLGTRGLPTVEVDLSGTRAYEIAPEGKGINAMMTALGCSRVHNAMAAAGVMHRAFLESMCWLENRQTFGAKLSSRPMLQKRVLDIKTQWYAGSALAFEAAKSFDLAVQNNEQEGWARIATALAKFKTAEQAVWCAEKALEIVGGNGYTEDYPTARLYRDAMVLRVWEGPEQIQALELMRMVAGKQNGASLFVNKLREVANALPENMEAQKARLVRLSHSTSQALKELQNSPDKVELAADEFLHFMSDALAYALLCDEAQWELSQHNDKTKLLVADNFYKTAFEGRQVPKMEQSGIHKEFNRIAYGLPVNADKTPKTNFSSGGPK
jgi:acyl-CoA dehydrogenase